MPLFVVSNKEYYRGAASILNTGALKAFCRERNYKQLIVIPSSVNEMLICPDYGRQSQEEVSVMVREVNDTEVDPEEQLADRAYLWHADSEQLIF